MGGRERERLKEEIFDPGLGEEGFGVYKQQQTCGSRFWGKKKDLGSRV